MQVHISRHRRVGESKQRQQDLAPWKKGRAWRRRAPHPGVLCPPRTFAGHAAQGLGLREEGAIFTACGVWGRSLLLPGRSEIKCKFKMYLRIRYMYILPQLTEH